VREHGWCGGQKDEARWYPRDEGVLGDCACPVFDTHTLPHSNQPLGSVTNSYHGQIAAL